MLATEVVFKEISTPLIVLVPLISLATGEGGFGTDTLVGWCDQRNEEYAMNGNVERDVR